LTIHFRSGSGDATVFTVTRRGIPERGAVETASVEDVTPWELWESVAGKSEELTAFLEQQAASNLLALWCWDAAWRKLRVTLQMKPTETSASWPKATGDPGNG
jgi:hypothetical protein